MKSYRPKFSGRLPMRKRIASKSNKKPYCHGHRNPRGIHCGKCVWSDTCTIDPGHRDPPPPEKIQGLIPPGEPCAGMVRRYCGCCHGDAIGEYDHRMSEYRCMSCHSMLTPNQTPPPENPRKETP